MVYDTDHLSKMVRNSQGRIRWGETVIMGGTIWVLGGAIAPQNLGGGVPPSPPLNTPLADLLIVTLYTLSIYPSVQNPFSWDSGYLTSQKLSFLKTVPPATGYVRYIDSVE